MTALTMYYHPLIKPGNASQSAAPTTVKPANFDTGKDVDPEIVTLSRSPVFDNTIYSVFADHVIDKKGHQVERYLSVVPKCLSADAIAGVAVLPVKDGKVGLIRVFRHPLGRWSWESIKGHVESGEDVRTAAARELLEESGYSVASNEFIDFGTVAPEAGVIKGRARLFTAAVTGAAGKAVDGELGHGKMAFYSRSEIDTLITAGEIEDGITLVILFKHLFRQNALE